MRTWKIVSRFPTYEKAKEFQDEFIQKNVNSIAKVVFRRLRETNPFDVKVWIPSEQPEAVEDKIEETVEKEPKIKSKREAKEFGKKVVDKRTNRRYGGDRRKDEHEIPHQGRSEDPNSKGSK